MSVGLRLSLLTALFLLAGCSAGTEAARTTDSPAALTATQEVLASATNTATLVPPTETPLPPTATPLPEIFFTPTPGATAEGGTGRVIFGLAQRENEVYSPRGVYALDVTSRAVTQLAGDEFNLQAVSPDGRQMLIQRQNELYVARVDGLGAELLSADFYGLSQRAALWLPGSRTIVAILTVEGQRGIWLLDDGSTWRQLDTSDAQPVELYPYFDTSRIYFVSGDCTEPGACTREKWYYAAADGLSVQELPAEITRPAFSPDGKVIAYGGTRMYQPHMGGAEEPVPALNMVGADGTFVDPPFARGGYPADFAFSRRGMVLAVLSQERSLYHGETAGFYLFLSKPPNWWNSEELTIIPGLWGRLAWSPDGGELALSSTTHEVDGSFSVRFWVYDVARGELRPAGIISAPAPAYPFITNIFWSQPYW